MKISGRVVANYKKGKNQNWLFVASSQYGRTIVKAVLSDAEADNISWNDYVQLSGTPRPRRRVLKTGEIVKDVLLKKPIVERRIRMNAAIQGNN